MILTTHALAGAAIGKNFDSLWIIIPLSLIFHFILDSLPHGEYIYSQNKTLKIKHIRGRIAIDLFFAFFFVFLFMIINNPSHLKARDVLFGSFFSMFPDFLTLLSFKFNFGLLKIIRVFHHWVHYASRTMLKNNYWNFSNAKNDFLISAIALFFLFL